MSIHIKLQTERSPSGNPQVTQPQFFIYKIKIIMETFALVKFKECFFGCFIVPWFMVLHCSMAEKNMDQPLGLSGFLNDLLDAVAFVEGT